jgi:hypothetical protein
MTDFNSSLDDQILQAQRHVAVESLDVSIGEITRMYSEGTLNLHPAYQRLFRWNIAQKSRLVESTLLGLPIPSIFVAQVDDGSWELIDGLQRVATLLEFQGRLRNMDGAMSRPSTLQGTKYLPGLEGRRWKDGSDGRGLSDLARNAVLRAWMNVRVIRRQSDTSVKFDLFQRLNSNETMLTPQELRSALIAAESEEFLRWVEELAQHPAFVGSTAITEKARAEQRDIELVLRFVSFYNWPDVGLDIINYDTARVLDDKAVELAGDSRYPTSQVGGVFVKTFETLFKSGGADVFRSPSGRFHEGAFDSLAMGLAFRFDQGLGSKVNVDRVRQQLWASPGFGKGSAKARPADAIRLGRRLFVATKP